MNHIWRSRFLFCGDMVLHKRIEPLPRFKQPGSLVCCLSALACWRQLSIFVHRQWPYVLLLSMGMRCSSYLRDRFEEAHHWYWITTFWERQKTAMVSPYIHAYISLVSLRHLKRGGSGISHSNILRCAKQEQSLAVTNVASIRFCSKLTFGHRCFPIPPCPRWLVALMLESDMVPGFSRSFRIVEVSPCVFTALTKATKGYI